MTDLLQQAIEQIEKLPAETQDALAARLLADLEDEQAWAASFAATSAEQWDRLAGLAQREIDTGETTPLEDVFPDKVSEE
jgi:hypothetical protein